MKFTIRHRWTNAVLWESEAESLKDAIRAALAANAVLTGADLTGADLTGADLRGAVLRDADLTGAVLRDADLTGADLRDAVLRGADLTGADLRDAVLTGAGNYASRSDGYEFRLFLLKDNTIRIMAGCRWFTFDEAREHWTRTRGGTALGDESLALVDHLERMANIAGWITTSPELTSQGQDR